MIGGDYVGMVDPNVPVYGVKSGKCTTTLGGNITFDPVREPYVIDTIDYLKEEREFGHFLRDMLRIMFESPETITNSFKLFNMMAGYNISPMGKKFFDDQAKVVNDMHTKVDAMYKMCLEMYTLVKMGKHIGLEDKVENMATAQFMLERQINEMCRNMGIYDKSVFESKKTQNIEQVAGDALEFIVNHYDSVVSELKSGIGYTAMPAQMVATNQIPMQTNQNPVSHDIQQSADIEDKPNIEDTTKKQEVKKSNNSDSGSGEEFLQVDPSEANKNLENGGASSLLSDMFDDIF